MASADVKRVRRVAELWPCRDVSTAIRPFTDGPAVAESKAGGKGHLMQRLT